MKITSEQKNMLLGTVLVLLAGILWSTVGIYVRSLRAAGLSTWDITLVRMSVSVLSMALYLVPFHRERLCVRFKDLWIFAGAGILSLLCMNYCYSESIQVSSLAVAGTLLYTAPIFVMLMSLLFFREKMTGRKLLALLLAFAGCALVSGIAGSEFTMTTKALFLGLGSGFSYALYSIFGRVALDRNYDSWTITFYAFVFGMAACTLLAEPGKIVAAAMADAALLLPMVLLGVTTGFAAYLLYTIGLTKLEPGRASIIASLELVSAAVLGVIAFQETIDLSAAVGIALLLCAVVVLNVQKKK